MEGTEDEDYRPRADDHLVEPFLAGLSPQRPAAEASRTGRRGCGGAVLIMIVLAGGVWLLA